MQEGLYLSDEVYWDSYGDDIDMEGICIGGCLDILKDLIGTPYQDIHSFIDKYKDVGFIWYFDIFSMTAEDVYRTLLQMKSAGWFNYAKGFVIGRVVFKNTFVDMTYRDAYKMALPEFDIVMDADIGHTTPRMTLINGAKMRVKSSKGKGSIELIIQE